MISFNFRLFNIAALTLCINVSAFAADGKIEELNVIFPDMKAGKAAYREKNYEVAYQNWLPIAESGFPRAKTELGKLYARGLGVAKDPKLAYALFQKAYQEGDKRALVEIGQLYEKGRGVPVNIIEARSWYQRAADEGQARGDFLIGALYADKKLSPYYGAPTPEHSQDFIKDTLRDFRKKQFGYAEALGDMYRLGLHVQPDPQKALVFLLVAEKYGSGTAARKARLLETHVNYDDFVETKKLASQIYQGQAKAVIKDYINIKEPEETFYQKAEREAEAAVYFQRAADNGYRRATVRLAELQSASKEAQSDEKSEAETIASLAMPEKKKYKIRGTLRTQYNYEDNFDLGTRGVQNESAFVGDALIGVHLYPTETITTYFQGRGFISEGDAQSNNADDEDEADESFFEMRQAWVEFDQLLSPVTSLKVGRQRFREERAIFWNRDLDAIRLSLDSTLHKGFLAIGQNLASYRTGSDNEFEGDEEDRLRLLGEYERIFSPDFSLSGRFLYENDHSGTLNIGQVVNDLDRDDEDFDLLWAGIRAEGQTKPKGFKNISALRYRADLMGVAGEEEITTSSSGPSDDERTITGSESRDVLGWAFDGSLSASLDYALQPTLTIGYAYGSGDDGNGTNTAFRQTDLHGNTSRFLSGLTRETERNYGEVLRPELSNIHILNVGTHVPIFNFSDMSLQYFRYWLDDRETGLRSTSINATLNGEESYLGHEINAAANFYLGREFDLEGPIAQSTLFRIRAGLFEPGDAFTGNDNFAYRGTGEFRIKF